MPARTGEQFLRGLVDDREVWVGSDKVASPVDHPSLRGAALALAEVFDLQHREADACLMPDPETGEPINVSHMIPRSREDLQRRHRGLECIAEYSVGLMGRTPDYMNVTYAGFAGRADEWAASTATSGAPTTWCATRRSSGAEDLSLTHTIVHSTVDATKGRLPVGLDPVQLHKVEDTEHGIVVRGSRVLATLAPFADELAVYPGAPMPDAAGVHALSFCIPMNTPGLKFICRDSVAGSFDKFDHPFSSRFDEQDAFVIFDNVEVPRERVFIDGNLAVYNSVMKTTLVAEHHAADHDPGANQARIRLGAGLRHGRSDQPDPAASRAAARRDRHVRRARARRGVRGGAGRARIRQRHVGVRRCGRSAACARRCRCGFRASTRSSARSDRTTC